MKKLYVLLALFAVGVFVAIPVYAVLDTPGETDSGDITVTADIPQATVSALFKLYNSWYNSTNKQHEVNYADPIVGTAFDWTKADFVAFSSKNDTGRKVSQWTNNKYKAVVIYAGAQGLKYQITSDGTGSFLGKVSGKTLPKNSFGCIAYSADDDLWDPTDPTSKQGPVPSGALVGPNFAALNPGKNIYTSETTVPTDNRIVTAMYGFFGYVQNPDDTYSKPWTPYTPLHTATTVADLYEGVTLKITIAQK